MSRMGSITVFIYEEEAKLINIWTLQYPNIETGGDLFGLWKNEREVVIQLAIGPGENCQRTPTAFFQDQQYLGDVGTFLTTKKGMCNIGEWHSHHSLDLPRPSEGDKQTVWRHMPRMGLQRFLLLIATIDNRGIHPVPGFHSFMFTSPGSAGRCRGEMFQANYMVLPGPNPYRATGELDTRLKQGAEMTSMYPNISKKQRRKLKRKEKKEQKKAEKQQKKDEEREKKANKKAEKAAFERDGRQDYDSHDTAGTSYKKLHEQHDASNFVQLPPQVQQHPNEGAVSQSLPTAVVKYTGHLTTEQSLAHYQTSPNEAGNRSSYV